MNFLAHLYLADNTPESLLGNMLGDFVDGDFRQRYSPEICRGIMLHRQVDKYTDSHPVFLRSTRRLNNRYRLMRGLIMDIFYDHFLARYWEEYSPEPLETFSQRVYRIFEEQAHLLPARLQQMLPIMVEGDWLLLYREIEGIRWVMRGMSNRLSRPNPLADSVEELQRCYAGLEADFREFFPLLIKFVEQEKQGR